MSLRRYRRDRLAIKLFEAIERDDISQAETLLKKGADPNLLLPTQGVTPFHLAVGVDRALDFVKLILCYGGNPNVRDEEGTTPVHVAASWGKLKCLQLLIVNGADPHTIDQEGRTALDMALDYGETFCIQALQEYERSALEMGLEDVIPQYNYSLLCGDVVDYVEEMTNNSVPNFNFSRDLSNISNRLPSFGDAFTSSRISSFGAALNASGLSTFGAPPMSSTRISNFGPAISPSDLESSHLTAKEGTKPVHPGAALPKTPHNTPEKVGKNRPRPSLFAGFRGNNRISPTDIKTKPAAQFNLEVMEPEKPYVDEVDSSQSKKLQEPPSYKHLFPKEGTAFAYPVNRPTQVTSGVQVSSPDPDVTFPKLQGSTGFQVKAEDRRKTQVYKRPGTGNTTYAVDCGTQVTRPSKLPLADSPSDPPRRVTRSWSKRDAKVGPIDESQEIVSVETKDASTGVQGYSLLESCFQRRGLSHLVNQTLHKMQKDKKSVEKKDAGTSMHIDSPNRDAATSMAADSPCNSPDVYSPVKTPVKDASTSPLIFQQRNFKSDKQEEKQQIKKSERQSENDAMEFLDTKTMKRFTSKQGIDCTSPDKSIEFVKSSSESCESSSAFLEKTSVWVSALDDSLNCEEDWEEDDKESVNPDLNADNPVDVGKNTDNKNGKDNKSSPTSDGNPGESTCEGKSDEQNGQSDDRRSENSIDKETETQTKVLEGNTESTAVDNGIVQETGVEAEGRQEEIEKISEEEIAGNSDDPSHVEELSEESVSIEGGSTNDDDEEEEMSDEDVGDEEDDGYNEDDDDDTEDEENISDSHDEVDTQVAVPLEATSMTEDLTTVTAIDEEVVQVSEGEQEGGSEEEDTMSEDEDKSSDCDEDEDTEKEFSTPAGDPRMRHQDSQPPDDVTTVEPAVLEREQDTDLEQMRGDDAGDFVGGDHLLYTQGPTTVEGKGASGLEEVRDENEKPSTVAKSDHTSEMTNLVDDLAKRLRIGCGSPAREQEPSKFVQKQEEQNQQQPSFLDYSFSEKFKRRLSDTLLARRGAPAGAEMSAQEGQTNGVPPRQRNGRFSDAQKKTNKVKFDYSVTKLPIIDAPVGETSGFMTKWAPGAQRPGCLKTTSSTFESAKAAVPSHIRQSKSEGGEKEPKVHFMISSHPRNLRGFDEECESPGMSDQFKESLNHRFAHARGRKVAEESPDKSEYCTPVSDPRLLKDPLVKTGTSARRFDSSALGSSIGSCRKKLLGSFTEVSDVTKEEATPVNASQTAAVSSDTQIIPEECTKPTSDGLADDDFKTKFLIDYADKLKKSILHQPRWKPYEGKDPLTEEEDTLKVSGTLSPGSATLVYNSGSNSAEEALLLDGGLVERRKQLLQAKARYMSDINSRSTEQSTSAGVRSKWKDSSSSSTQACYTSSGQSSDQASSQDMDTLDGDFRRKLMLRTKSNISTLSGQNGVPSYLVDHEQETIPYAVWVPKGYKGARPSHGQGDDTKAAFRRRRAENTRKFTCLNRSRRDRSDLMSDMEFLTSDNTTDESLQSMLGLDKDRYAQIFRKPAYQFEKSLITTDDSLQSVDERQTTYRFIQPTPGPQNFLTEGAASRSLMTSDDSLLSGDHDRYSQRCIKPSHEPSAISKDTSSSPETASIPSSQPSSETESLPSQEQEYNVENEVSPFAKSRRSFDPEATVEYLYTDNGDGMALIERRCPSMSGSSHYSTALEDQSTLSCEDTILYDWKAYFTAESEAESEAEVVHIPPELQQLSDKQLRERLEALGELPGPITCSTRKLYLLHLVKLLKDPSMVRFTSEQHTGYLPELAACFHGNPVKDMMEEEEVLSRQFEDPQRMWREGRLKSSFNYLLLDPRVTKNLPARGRNMTDSEIFKVFISAVFYIGKGKRARPYAHFGEAIQQMEKPRQNPSDKVKHILDIWACGLGVVSLHCYQSVIPVEAYTREACMVEAFGLSRLTNKKKGDYYGVAATWRARKKRLMGVYLLKKAMQIFLSEGERQIRPADVKIGQ